MIERNLIVYSLSTFIIGVVTLVLSYQIESLPWILNFDFLITNDSMVERYGMISEIFYILLVNLLFIVTWIFFKDSRKEYFSGNSFFWGKWLQKKSHKFLLLFFLGLLVVYNLYVGPSSLYHKMLVFFKDNGLGKCSYWECSLPYVIYMGYGFCNYILYGVPLLGILWDNGKKDFGCIKEVEKKIVGCLNKIHAPHRIRFAVLVNSCMSFYTGFTSSLVRDSFKYIVTLLQFAFMYVFFVKFHIFYAYAFNGLVFFQYTMSFFLVIYLLILGLILFKIWKYQSMISDKFHSIIKTSTVTPPVIDLITEKLGELSRVSGIELWKSFRSNVGIVVIILLITWVYQCPFRLSWENGIKNAIPPPFSYASVTLIKLVNTKGHITDLHKDQIKKHYILLKKPPYIRIRDSSSTKKTQ